MERLSKSDEIKELKRLHDSKEDIIGIVFTATQYDDDIRNYVLYMEQNFYIVFKVHITAFLLNENDVIKTNSFDQVPALKNVKRRKERELNIGDHIRFKVEGSKTIKSFSREGNLYEAKTVGNLVQMKMVCMKSPYNPVVYNTALGYLSLSNLQDSWLMANVPFYGWISFGLINDDQVSIEFAEFESTNEELHCDADWNLTFARPPSDDEDDEYEMNVRPSKENEHRENFQTLHRLFGYLVSDRHLFVKDRPADLFAIPYRDPTRVIHGVSYYFDAYYCDLAKCWVASKWQRVLDVQNLNTIEENGVIYVTMVARMKEDYPTLYFAETFGYLDDPTGVLDKYAISRYASSTLRVRAIDSAVMTPYGRFRIMGCDEPPKLAKAEKHVQEERKSIMGLIGVIIGEDRRVFSAKYPTVRFYIPAADHDKFVIGHRLKFNAKATEDGVYECTDMHPMNEKTIRHKAFRGRACFKTVLKTPPLALNLKKCWHSDDFGLVDDPNEILKDQKGDKQVWISEAGINEKTGMRFCRTPFFVVFAGSSEEPKFDTSKFTHAKTGANLGGSILSRDGRPIALDLTEATAATAFSSNAGHFVLPTPRTTVPRQVNEDMSRLHLDDRKNSEELRQFGRPDPQGSRSGYAASTVSTLVAAPKACGDAITAPLLLKDCGCPEDGNEKCIARDILMDLMNTPEFSTKLLNEDNDLLSQILDLFE